MNARSSWKPGVDLCKGYLGEEHTCSVEMVTGSSKNAPEVHRWRTSFVLLTTTCWTMDVMAVQIWSAVHLWGVAGAVQAHFKARGVKLPVEVETGSLEDVQQVLDLRHQEPGLPIDRIMLDNMTQLDASAPGVSAELDLFVPPGSHMLHWAVIASLPPTMSAVRRAAWRLLKRWGCPNRG